MEKIYVASNLPNSALSQLNSLDSSIEYWDGEETISEQELIRNLMDKTILICGIDVQVTEKVMNSANSLKLITNIGDGYSNIDINFATKANIIVTNAPTKNSIASTAEQTVTLLLSVSREILKGDSLMRSHDFKGWRVTGYVGGHQVYGKKIVIVGMGRVGKKVVELLSGFAIDLYFVDPKPVDPLFVKKYRLKQVTLEEGLRIADYVTLNCDLTKDNYNMITSKQLNMMKKSSFLINCARGPLVHEKDLTTALKNNVIAGAALDVYEFEPKVGAELASLPEVVLTPHAGNATVEARQEMALDAIENVQNYVNNKPLNYIVNIRD